MSSHVKHAGLCATGNDYYTVIQLDEAEPGWTGAIKRPAKGVEWMKVPQIYTQLLKACVQRGNCDNMEERIRKTKGEG